MSILFKEISEKSKISDFPDKSPNYTD